MNKLHAIRCELLVICQWLTFPKYYKLRRKLQLNNALQSINHYN